MSRSLRPVILTVNLLPHTFAVREPSEIGDLPREPTRDDVSWETARPGNLAPEQLGGWQEQGDVPEDIWPARATLPLNSAGDVITDAAFDVGANGYRIADSPPVRAAGLRGWLGIELHAATPTGTSIVYRLTVDGVDYYWAGAAWALATDAALHWSSKADVQAQITSFPPDGRELLVRARLSSTVTTARPSFFGVTFGLGLRQFGSEDDALIRTLVAELRAQITCTGVAKLTTAAGSGAGPITIGPEKPYDVQGVDAVFDLTDDPDELVELAGSFAAGPPATWTPTTPIDDAHEVLIEFEFAPLVVFHQTRDLVQIKRSPAVLVAPTGVPARVAAQSWGLIRNLEVDPPTALGAPGPDLYEQPIEVSVIGELGADVRRLTEQLRGYLNGTGELVTVSPESGQIVSVHEVEPFLSTTGSLAVGLHEARGQWALTYHASGATQLEAVHLTRTGGIAVSVQEG